MSILELIKYPMRSVEDYQRDIRFLPKKLVDEYYEIATRIPGLQTLSYDERDEILLKVYRDLIVGWEEPF